MNTDKRATAATELVLLFPATLFMMALIARQLSPLGYEPAHIAQQIIMWYAGRIWTLWILLISLPLIVLCIGCITLLRESRQAAWQLLAAIRSDLATFMVTVSTLISGAVLVVVIIHMLMN